MFEAWGRGLYRSRRLVLVVSLLFAVAAGVWGTGDGNVYTNLFFQNAWDSSRGLPGPTGVLTGFMGGSNGASFTGASSPYASAATDPYVAKHARTFSRNSTVFGPASANTGTASRH